MHHWFGGLIFGGAYTWRGLLLEFYGMLHGIIGEVSLSVNFYVLSYPLCSFNVMASTVIAFHVHLIILSISCLSGCYKITTVFSHAQTVVLCVSCSMVLCQPTGGRARLTEGMHIITCM